MLSVQNVNLFYGAAQALRGVSLSATVGRVTCLLGRNGVGKTSLLRAICGLQPIASGSIALDGHEVSRLPAYERARRGVALVPQGREIFSLLTVKENLETGFAPLNRDLKKLARKYGATLKRGVASRRAKATRAKARRAKRKR